ncbi:DnaB-like helicase C-terminal domain-containing protein [Leptodesmis sp.]|uniref:replicative DNA helicase n=1 Tax=Leptodesmis sp. TaxID=3100501 RepID=UPI003D098925
MCGRTKDGDCRTAEAENLVLCHSNLDLPSGERIGDYVFQRNSKDGMWGVWIYQKEGKNGKISGKKPLRVQKRERYYYSDRQGGNLVAVERVPKGEGKEFYQYHWDGSQWVPGMPGHIRDQVPIYRYQDVRKAISEKRPVFMVEGEAKCDRLWELGLAATTTLGGSKKYRSYGKHYKTDLEGAVLILCPDRDKVGVEHMEEISRDFPDSEWCRVFPASPIWQCLPDNHGLDIGDWIELGATREDILEAVQKGQEGKTREPDKTPEALRESIASLAAITDPFERAIAENEVGEAFKIRGNRLERLVSHHEARLNSSAVKAASEVAYGLFEKVEERSKSGIQPGLMSGFYALDTMTHGFNRGDLIVVAGRTSMGKSGFAGNLMVSMSTAYQQPVLLFSMEMTAEKIINRLVASYCRIPAGRINAGRIDVGEWESLERAIGKVAELPIFIDDSPSPSIDEIEVKTRQLKEQHGAIAGVFVDHLQFIDFGGEFRAQELARITKRLKVLAREADCPIFALSQINRGVEARTDKRPNNSDLKESGAIEQDADLIIMLYREEYYNPETTDSGIAEMIITKNRNGATGTAKLLFEAEFTQFRNLVP